MKNFLQVFWALLFCISLHAMETKDDSIFCEEEKAPSHAQEGIDKEKQVIVFPDFPFVPSPSSYLQNGRESAIAVSQQRAGEHQSMAKVNRGNTYLFVEELDLSLHTPKQRQKLSTAATQCGVLTSFSPNSPTF